MGTGGPAYGVRGGPRPYPQSSLFPVRFSGVRADERASAHVSCARVRVDARVRVRVQFHVHVNVRVRVCVQLRARADVPGEPTPILNAT